MERDVALGYMAGMSGDIGTAEKFLAPAVAAANDPANRLYIAYWLGILHLLRADGPKKSSHLVILRWQMRAAAMLANAAK
ncbi:hypothetical protein AB0D08_40670 [Kitasatospora sp. NPDC048540]|uniref:hypothetical protein n=1 Tax=Kitasatospora sp. NPDC048540 TaxID=3155634 RepID=UPI00340B55F1